MGFNNPVIGGLSALIRTALQSPNFVHAISGWSVNKDGSAEFQNATIRGTLTGSTIIIPDGAGPGTPRIVIDNTGITAYSALGPVLEILPGNLGSTPMLISGFLQGIGANQASLQLGNGSFVLTAEPGIADAIRFALGPNGSIVASNAPGPRTTNNPDQYQFGGGAPGGYYSEEWSLSAQVFTTGVLAALTAMVLNGITTKSDYLTAMNTVTGVWTCPVTSEYEFTLFAGFTTYVSGSRMLLNVQNTTGAGKLLLQGEWAPANTGTTMETLSGRRYVTAGDTLTFNAFQLTGANRTINTIAANPSILRISRSL